MNLATVLVYIVPAILASDCSVVEIITTTIPCPASTVAAVIPILINFCPQYRGLYSVNEYLTIAVAEAPTCISIITDFGAEPTTVVIPPIPSAIVPTSISRELTSNAPSQTSSIGSLSTHQPKNSSSGLAYKVFFNPYNLDNDTSYYRDFNTSYFRDNSLPVIACGIAHNVNFQSEDGLDFMLPGQTKPLDIRTVAILYRGYFTVPFTAYYDFRTIADDFSFLWLGDAAYRDWNADNAVYYSIGGSGLPSHRQTLIGGQKVPVRLLWANAGGGGTAYFYLNIYDANGTLLYFTDDLGRYFTQPVPGDFWVPAPRQDCPFST